jgi:hypothetical protein
LKPVNSSAEEMPSNIKIIILCLLLLTMKFSLALGLLLAAEGASAFSIQGRSGNRAAFVQSKNFAASLTTSTALAGILDEINSDSYDLMSSDGGGTEANINDAYEIFLGDLVFSTNDPRVDIMNKFDLASDPEFVTWLQQKTENSRDPDERLALRDLFDMIEDVTTRVKVSKLTEEREAMEAEKAEQARVEEAEAEAGVGISMSNADVLRKATEIQTAKSSEVVVEKVVKKNFYETELTPEIRLSYESLLKKVLPPYKAGATPKSVVFNLYEQFDAQFMKVLNERADNGENDSQALLQAIAEEQQKRISTATDALKSVLSLGELPRMEGAIVKLAREGKIDEPFLLLLEANANQAKLAGARGPAQLMERLKKRATDEKDKQATSKEIRLIRQLLRTDDVLAREKILEDAFTPREGLLVPGTAENAQKAADGELPEQGKPMPDVPPPDFINACKAVMINFGNLGVDGDARGDLATRIRKIAAEAEVVATRIYGQGMTVREQQERMWKDQTTSIFDLETMEIDAERHGSRAPWANENDDSDMMMPGFDAQGKMQIGGV